MPQTTFSIRMDSKLKEDFDKLCEDFGMSMSTAINVFARAVVRERRIPFDVASADAPAYAADRRALYNASPVASRMLRIMQQLSADAEKAGSADMTLDEINAEIVAARSEK